MRRRVFLYDDLDHLMPLRRWATEQARQQKRQLEEEVKKALEEKERMTQQAARSFFRC